MGSRFDTVVVHYDEIGIKGKNRINFERFLINNIKAKAKAMVKSVKREYGQITIYPSKKDYAGLKDVLSKIPGIAYFSFAKECSLDFEKLKAEAVDYVSDIDFSTFKVDTQRHNKNYVLNSMQISALLGEAILNKYQKKVKMKNPDLLLNVEISDKSAYISTEDIPGIGGMPTEPKKKVVCLLSGGFDSPVAGFMMMKRGCEVIFVHFSNKNQLSESVKGKIFELVKQLSKFQQNTKLYVIPFEDIQKQIIMNTNSEIRMLVYRRFMLRIASGIADMNNARFLVVGDSMSQVASQTIENLEATYPAAEKHVLSPLIGMNKREIIDISKKIGTFEISAQPYGDCCSYFLPKHPVLHSTLEMLEKIESRFNIEALVENSIDKAVVTKFN